MRLKVPLLLLFSLKGIKKNILTYSIFPVKMLYMFTRLLKPPSSSFFLFGPRGTGKSTWIRQNFSKAVFYDLLDSNESLRLSKEPHLLYRELASLKPKSWVVIDEVQKVPQLLDEIHRLIEDQKLKFVLSGSSARKLKKGQANLLAGRARLETLFPLTSAEVAFNLEFPKICQKGMLPSAYQSEDFEEYLRAYVQIYLNEEIKGEALTRNIGHFARFLEVAARQNGQVTNVANISRDAQVARQTVQGYFDILSDTLIGRWLPAWKLKRATKQVVHPKFYFFDPGVSRALSGRQAYPPTPEELGFLLETFILNELLAYLAYHKLHYPVTFWSSHDGVEVDFFFETKKGYRAIEVKSNTRWDKKYGKGLKRLHTEIGDKSDYFGIYLGSRQLSFDHFTVYPVQTFLKKLWNGEIVP